MKKNITFLSGILSFILLVAFAPVTDLDGFYRIDTTTSKVQWVGTKITGKTHEGTVNITEGGLSFRNGALAGGKFTIDMSSINVTDLDGTMKTKLEGHLKGEDFFHVEKFTTANFDISSVEGDNVKGNLTIKGITHEITFPTKVVMNDTGELTATADIAVNRAKYDVRYGSGSFFDNLGDKAIDDVLKFTVVLKAKK